MEECPECQKLATGLEKATLEYLRAILHHEPDAEPTKLAQQRRDAAQEILDQHKATHA